MNCFHFACPTCWAEVYTLLGDNSPMVAEHKHPMQLIETHTAPRGGQDKEASA